MREESYRLLYTSLINMTTSREWNTKSVGKALRRCRDRIVGGLMLCRAGQDSNGAKWQVVATDTAAAQQNDANEDQPAKTDDLPF